MKLKSLLIFTIYCSANTDVTMVILKETPSIYLGFCISIDTCAFSCVTHIFILVLQNYDKPTNRHCLLCR
jgi:hypothetical protein